VIDGYVALGLVLAVLLCRRRDCAAGRHARGGRPPGTRSNQPALSHRLPPNTAAPQGAIKLDVVVTNIAGRAVGGLQQQDFTLLDNKKPQPIRSFRAVDGSTGNGTAADPPVEVILLIDATNNSLHNIAYERSQIATFLRQNGGRLVQPVTLMVFSEKGVMVQPQPSTDGNLLARSLDKSEATMHMVPRSGGYDAIERMELSLKTLRTITAAETPKPGRKLLIWIGPGWPMLQGPGYQTSQAAERSVFNSIVETTRTLREARITMYNANQADPAALGHMGPDYYKNFLKGVSAANRAESGDLAVPVFAVHSGGLVMSRGDDLVRELNRCIAEAAAYYTLSFDPPNADHTDEYHDLRVTIDKAGMTARTNAGYYSEPLPKP
jgi:VWFA-related protein